jgi:putative transposase
VAVPTHAALLLAAIDGGRGSGYSGNMPRSARLVTPSVPHHVTPRGNGRAAVFHDAQDYGRYLSLLREHKRAHALTVLGYCLMPNHVHLIVIPETAQALALALGRTHMKYALVANARRATSGHCWQSRFYSCPMDHAHLVAAMQYVERNPVRAGLVQRAWEYPWSSAAMHVGDTEPSGLSDVKSWERDWPHALWRTMLMRNEDGWDTREIRVRTRMGKPLGSAEFTRALQGHELSDIDDRPLP